MNTSTQIQNLPSAIPHFLLHSVLPVTGVIVLAIFGSLLALTILELAQLLILRLRASSGSHDSSDMVLLGLTFPSDTSKSAFATEQLYTLFHARTAKRAMPDSLALLRDEYSLELVGTRDGGIRYVMAVPRKEKDQIRNNLISFLPGLKVEEEIEDYLPKTIKPDEHYDIIEMKLSADFILPLQDRKLITEHDTAAFITGQMTKLAPSELVGLQLLIAPVTTAAHPHVNRRLKQTKRVIKAGQPLAPVLGERYFTLPLRFLPLLLGFVLKPLIWALKGVGKILIELPAYITDDKYHTHRASANAAASPQSALDPYETELHGIVRTKISQHLYEATIRIIAVADTEAEARRRTQAIITSLRSFSSQHQTIVTRRIAPILDSPSRRLEHYRNRTFATHPVAPNMVLSGSEISDLYHFPNTDLTKTEGLIKSRSPELAAPLSLKGVNPKFDVVLGVNSFNGELSPIGLTLDQRQKHTYIIGKTGMGKSTLLVNAIYQDMMSGKGLAVFDPHGDAFQELLGLVPEHRRDDVVVFNPADRDWPIGLNILDPGIAFASVDDKHEWITSTVISVFTKLAAKEYWGPRMEHILRNATLTALHLPNPTLFTLQQLLTDRKFQKQAAAQLTDPILKQFWAKELSLLGNMQLSTVTAPLTQRLGQFITTKLSRHILLQEKSTISISEIMDQGKILLINLSKGDLGEDQSRFFGTILTSFIWMAAYQHTKQPEAERKDFFVYVDEFQNFATPSFAEITSEGRKFHVSLITSHQNIAQIEDAAMLKIVAGNASTIICLKASPSDEEFILPFMKPEVTKGDIVNLEPYRFFVKTSAQTAEDAFSGQIAKLNIAPTTEARTSVLGQSRSKYAKPLREVEAYIDSILKVTPKSAPSKRKPKAKTSTKATPKPSKVAI